MRLETNTTTAYSKDSWKNKFKRAVIYLMEEVVTGLDIKGERRVYHGGMFRIPRVNNVCQGLEVKQRMWKWPVVLLRSGLIVCLAFFFIPHASALY